MDILSASNGRTADLYRQQNLSRNLEQTARNAEQNTDDAQLMQACVEFEAYFTNLLFKQMRSTINSEGSFIKKNQGEKIFTEMLDEEISSNMANGNNGIGLATSLFEQMKRANVGITYEQYLEKQNAQSQAENEIDSNSPIISE